MNLKRIILLILFATFLFGCSNKDSSSDDVVVPPTVEPTVYEDIKIFVDDDKDLKVLQITDTHFGDPDLNINNGSPEETIKYMEYLIKVGDPDIIVCTGDQIVNTGTNGLTEYVEIMEEFKTPWTFVFGNHDIEAGAWKKRAAEKLYELSLQSEYFLYTEDYIDTNMHRYGNFVIEVYNEQSQTLRGGLVCLDTGLNDRVNGGYEGLTTEQVEWYVESIEELDAKYEGEDVVPTILFQHMHTPVFYDAYLNAVEYKNNPESQEVYRGEFVIDQFLSSLNISSIENEGNSDDKGMFEEIVRLGSTKGIFVGHTHYHKLQYTYDGVLLGFGPQTGYANGFFGDSNPRSTYQYNLGANFEIETIDIKQPTFYVSDSKLELTVGEDYELVYLLNDIEGDIVITMDGDLISYEKNPETIVINALKPGTMTINFKAPYELEFECVIEIKEVINYGLYDFENNLIMETTQLFTAIDELFSTNMQQGAYVKDIESDLVVFTFNEYTYAIVTDEGVDSIYDTYNDVTNGYFSNIGTKEEDLKLYTQSDVSVLQYTNKDNIGFLTRPHDFDTTNTDTTGGYYPSTTDPNHMWNGWRSGLYKSAVTVAQFVSWADIQSAGNKQYLTYDLVGSKMTPSHNANQPIRADIWLGNSNGADVARMYGISFDAGSIYENKDLADGTTRSWDIYVEDIVFVDGLATYAPAPRTILGQVGTATWDKNNNMWIHDFIVTLELEIFDSKTEAFKSTFKVISDDITQEFEYISTSIVDSTHYRFTYGVNFTPDITKYNRSVPDITNKATWSGLTQIDTGRYYNDTYLGTIGFMDGRLRTDGRQIGIYGCDVLKTQLYNNCAVFSFRY